MSRKLISILLSVMIIGMTLAGCGKDNTGDSGDAVSNTNNKGGEKVKIVYSIWGTAEEQETTQAIADQFNASQDRIEVTVISIPNETYVTRLNTMATANQLPDCGMMNEKSVLEWSDNGMLADISSMYEGAESKPLDSLAYKFNGKTVAYASANEVLLLYYNKDMFDKAGVAYPPTKVEDAWTWDEFVDNAKKLTIDSNGKHPGEDGFNPDSITQYGCMVENYTWQLEQYCLSNGGGFYTADGSGVAIGEEASMEAIQKVADLYLVDHVAPLSTGLADDGVPRSLIAGTVAMTTNGAWNIGSCLPDAKADGLNYGIAVLPYMKDKITLCTSGANAVFSSSEHQEEAMEWVKWYVQEQNCWGLISSGIWMPTLEKWYTDETLTHQWLDNPNFPPYEDCKSALVDNAMSDAARSAGWFYTNHTNDFITMLSSILGDVWTGKTTAKDAITSNLDALEAIIADNK